MKKLYRLNMDMVNKETEDVIPAGTFVLLDEDRAVEALENERIEELVYVDLTPKTEDKKDSKKATKKGDKADENATPETAIAD